MSSKSDDRFVRETRVTFIYLLSLDLYIVLCMYVFCTEHS